MAITLDAGPSPGDAYRFSFRLAGTRGRWKPTQGSLPVIKSGDQVGLFCHSMGPGPFANVQRPPVIAVAANVKHGVVAFPIREISFPSHLIRAYDQHNLEVLRQDEMDAFEKMGIISDRGFPPMLRNGTSMAPKDKEVIGYRELSKEPYRNADL